MKIEIGESLMLSWLRHVKECQIVQTNWKASSAWELNDLERLEGLRDISSSHFKENFGYDLYKGNSGIMQIIAQAEIDALGINFDNGETNIYAIDIAFHEAGLNYGSRDETVTRVIKKCIRTAMCIRGYYQANAATVIFASPKINPAVYTDLQKVLPEMTKVLNAVDIHYDIRIICNEDFSDKMLEPVLNSLDNVSDTSELFMRSLQMYNLFARKKPKNTTTKTTISAPKKVDSALEAIEYSGTNGLEEMKIGVIARTVLRKVLESGNISPEEIAKMQTKEYSKKTFDIQFPLLLHASGINEQKPLRYYSKKLTIYGEHYFLCSEWFEVPANNDRPHLLTWLAIKNTI